MSEAKEAYDPARLLRGSQLAVMRFGPGEYAVQGSHGVRYVNLHADPPCDCEDMNYRNAAGTGVCKHVAAARLQEGDAGLMASLGNLLLSRQRARGEPDEDADPHGERNG